MERSLQTGLLLLLIGSSFTQVSAQNIDFGKSYINVTKGVNGGTLETGDIIEIRASFVVRAGTYDSCAFYDAVPAGTTYIAGSIRVLTNEGKVYKQFTDARNDDEGWFNTGNITIHLGYNQTPISGNPANRYRRGRVANTHRPSFYGSTCIMIASFRVRVNAPTNSIISTGGGRITYKAAGTTTTVQTHTFPFNTVAVYTNYGICPNSVGANALGTEFNGTFGSGKDRNRGASPNVPVGYTYNIFTANSPQDYYYGVPNNTSINTGYTTSNAWPKPDAARRVFAVWDIIGDHTGAASPTLGNPAADTLANPNAGYMLVINAAYRIDSAFQQTISGLCPNTYYEISCWVRNICSECGCDSAGRGAQSVGYIPTATGDSSGVYPNLTFDVDGIDYYTTGNIMYTGTWVKKGFTFLTGPTQTSFTLKLFNNAPGGGGNDWALDDISVATCNPDLLFTPSNNPTICAGNVADIGCIIRSYFGNYTHYKWQKSTNGGVSWTETGIGGIGTPVWTGSTWEYKVSYPSFIATAADNGTRFKVVIATTEANLANPACAYSGNASTVTLTVINCSSLSMDILSFSGDQQKDKVVLKWATNQETEAVQYKVERSSDGKAFTAIATLAGSTQSENVNFYQFTDPYSTSATIYYRIRLVSSSGTQKLSRTVKLDAQMQGLMLAHLPNPFTFQLQANIEVAQSGMLQVQLFDNNAGLVRHQQLMAVKGMNQLTINTAALPAGVYTLTIKSETTEVTKRLLKQRQL